MATDLRSICARAKAQSPFQLPRSRRDRSMQVNFAVTLIPFRGGLGSGDVFCRFAEGMCAVQVNVHEPVSQLRSGSDLTTVTRAS